MKEPTSELGRIRGQWRIIAAMLVGVIVVILELTEVLAPLDAALLESRFRLDERRADPSLVLVEADAASIDKIGYWPLPRSAYASAIDRLLGAGIEMVAVDVDFSSRSVVEEDNLLAEALRRWGNKVILATYGQRASANDHTSMVVSRPMEPLDDLAELATVNVIPDRDGRVRTYPVGQWLGSDFSAALAVILAGTGRFDANSFILDFSIDLGSIPRIRLIDLLEGRAELNDDVSRAVIGTTSIDAGDRLTVPVYGNINGVELQAIAYSSIVSGRMLQATGPAITVVGLVILLWICQYLIRLNWLRASLALVGLGVGAYLASLAIQVTLPISLNIAAWLIALTAWLLVTLVGRLEEQGRSLVTQHAQIRLHDSLLRTVIEENFDGVLITDADDRIEFLSPAGARLLNKRARTLIGASLVDQVPILALIGTEIESDKVVRREIEYRVDHNEDPLTLAVAVGTTIVKGTPRRFHPTPSDQFFRTYIFHDMTARRRAEEAHKHAMEESERIQRAKTEFLSNMSHELRTPLNAIIGFADVISNEHMGPVGNDSYREYAGLIKDSGSMLLEVINTILEVSRVDAGMLKLNDGAVNLAAVADWCSQLVAGWTAAGQRNVEVVIEDKALVVECDELLIRQIVINLLSNSYKFTEEGGSIVVKVGTTAQGLAFIEVSDDGIGMDQENLTRLFEAFYQIDGAFARRHGGSGLGLYLVRRYADLHGADIKVSSEPGRGTTIRLTFPLERCRPPQKGDFKSSSVTDPAPAEEVR